MASDEQVQVVVRLRPFLPREQGQRQAAWMPSPTTVQVKVLTTQLAAPPKEEEKMFAFDHCFSSVKTPSNGNAPVADQQCVYETIGRDYLLGSALAGYNSCLFAYGQTGSGKTYTVLGSERDPGIVPRLTTDLFEQGNAQSDEMRVSASFLEIYNESLKDLLNPDLKRKKPLYVHQHPQLGVYVPHLSEEAVVSHGECMALLDFGNKIRATSQTNMNSTSSRSHALFILRITSPIQDGQHRRIRSSTLNLIDLAGSERVKKSGAAGQRMREGQNINSSLSVLGQVISKLAAGKGKHVPFRQSKLTYLLTDALSGNSRTLMVAAISPALSESEETLGTLRFASSVKKIKLVAVKNEKEVEENDLLLQTMRSEMEELRVTIRNSGLERPEARRLKNRAEAVEHALMSMQTRVDSTMWDQARAAQADVDRQRREALAGLSLPLAIGGALGREHEGVSATSPYLLNISNDVSLDGKLLYILPEGAPIGVGADTSNRIRLLGLGITSKLCELTVAPGGLGLEVRYAGRGGRLLVNGQVVADSAARPLKHGAKLVFGRAFAFRVVVPLASKEGAAIAAAAAAARAHQLPSPVAEEDEVSVLESALTPEVQADLPVGALLERLSIAGFVSDADRVDLLRRARALQDDVDEANDLIREIESPLQQQLEVALDLRPAVGPAQLLLQSSPSSGPSTPLSGAAARPPRLVVNCCRLQDDELIAAWPLPRFYMHLEELRDRYQQRCDREREGLPVDGRLGLTVAWDQQALRRSERLGSIDDDDGEDGDPDNGIFEFSGGESDDIGGYMSSN